MSHYRFHTTIHARPATVEPGEPLQRGGESFPTLRLPPEEMSAPLAVSFETAAETLARLPRMFVEPDGSFVWPSPSGEQPAWQVDGVLYDRENRLLLVDLKGACPAEEFDRLLGAFGWPRQAVVFQLVREGVFLAEPDFRRWALWSTRSAS